jgi:hypothetical protein
MPGQTQKELAPDAGEETIAKLDKMRYADGEHTTAKIRGQL